jgi:zeaxanthin glucosyltransferase
MQAWMAHFALLCPPFFSHLRVFEAVGEELIRRGHKTTFLLDTDPGASSAKSNLQVRTVAARGSGGTAVRNATRPTGPLGILRTVADAARSTERLCAAGPEQLAAIGADAIIGDQVEAAAGLLAAHMNLPHISVACGLPINSAPGIPMPFLGWRYDPSPKGVEWITGGERVAHLLLARQRRAIETWSDRFGISRRSSLEECLSPSTQIAQISSAFDFPRPLPTPFHAVGRIRAAAEATPLDFRPDPTRPFVFASLGTLQGGRLRLFRAIAKACRAAGAQLLVAHCGLLSAREAASVGADFITDFAPQQAVLARADLCITHAGLNTVLDALAAGVPLLALPIAFDQPGVAARIVHHQVGQRIAPWRASAGRLQRLIELLLGDARYRANAAHQGEAIRSAGGLEAAADLIESALVPHMRKLARA